MYSIGTLSEHTKVKVPTIRYYEEIGLLAEAGRTAGNQRRYDDTALERLSFIRHARDLGFPIDAIRALITLQNHPDRSCAEASEIADQQLSGVREKIAKLQSLEQELSRISEGCSGAGQAANCYVLASLADHSKCDHDH
ncbi:helix-turn-helix domain-containing protein [Thalassobius sp. I31.1]|uniref:MerR family transcriptional regulator n=1 Tax=Thalassobius sp. I31.1 TaxID=2109912 RepID=UPI000D1A2F26|nr:helix-turn-helix domain-containing protein [Thalassobius sp. I31.1]